MVSQSEIYREREAHYRSCLGKPEVLQSSLFQFIYERGASAAEAGAWCLENGIRGVCFWSSVAFTHGVEVLSRFGYDPEKTRELFASREVALPLAELFLQEFEDVIGAKNISMPELHRRLGKADLAWLGVADAGNMCGYAHLIAVIRIGEGQYAVWNTDEDKDYSEQTGNDAVLSRRSIGEIHSLLMRLATRTSRPRFNMWFFKE